MEVTQHYNNMNDQLQQNDAEVQEYQSRETNRSEAIALLNKLKSREMAVSQVHWKNGQPTLVESSSKLYWEARLTNKGFTRPEMRGLPATDSCARVPSSWESKLDRRRRAGYTLEETPTMAFKASGHLPAHYYMDESALESYVESLTKES